MISLGRWQVSSHRLGMQDYGVSLDGKGKAREMPVYLESESDYFQWLGLIDQKVGRGRLGRV